MILFITGYSNFKVAMLKAKTVNAHMETGTRRVEQYYRRTEKGGGGGGGVTSPVVLVY